MRRRESFILFFVSSFFILGSFFVGGQKVLAVNTDIIINEIGAYEASGHEWLEIFNKGTEQVDLAGWKLWEQNGTSQNHKITTSTTDSILSPGEYGAIVQDDIQFILEHPTFTGSIFDSSFTLNESGEEIGLKDSAENFVEKFTYISATHFSLQRKDPNLVDYTSANWAEHASGNSLGLLNIFEIVPVVAVPTSTTTTTTETTSTPSTPIIPVQNTEGGGNQNVQSPPVQNLSPLKINELVSDPETGNEWIELYNTSPNSIDIAGAMVCDARDTISTCKKILGVVGANSWLQIDLQTRSFLNNSGDSVIFKNSVGTVIDRIDYNDELVPDQGQSLARKLDGIDTNSDDDWIVTDTITPGKANIILESGEDNTQEISQKTTPTTTKTSVKTTKKPTPIFVWNIEAPFSAAPGEEVIINAEGTADPRGGLLSFVWDLGDGNKISGSEIKTVFAISGTYVIKVFASSTSGYGEGKEVEITIGGGLSQNAEIIISEVLPNPDGNDTKEFIELKNNTKTQVNLFGWFLRVKDKKYVFPENTIIPADGILVFYKAVTKINLLNSASKIELLNKDKDLVDLVKYDKPKSGESYTLINNEWRWAEPTPGKVYISFDELKAGAGTAKTVKKTKSRKSYGPLIKNIIDIREGVKGQSVRITGVVSVLPNVFGSQYFYINSGNAGIQIYHNKKDFPELELGDLVEIKGTVSEVSGIKRVNIKNKKSIDILAIGKSLTTIPLELDNIDDGLAGALVVVEGEITEIKTSFMYVDNGAGEIKIYFKKNAKIDKQKIKEGERVKLVGILEKVKDEWQVWPRSNEDIESLGMVGEVLGEKISTNNKNDTLGKYFIVTIVGIVSLFVGLLAKGKGAVVFGSIKKWWS